MSLNSKPARNPGMALIEAIQFLLDEVVRFDTDPSKVQRAASLRAEIAELEAYDNDLTQAEEERVAFFEQQEEIHKAQVAAQMLVVTDTDHKSRNQSMTGLAGGPDGKPFDPETGKGSLIAGAIEDMKERLEGAKGSPLATNDPAAQ